MISNILIFDRNAILSNNIHFWREVGNLGECIVPQSVIEELSSIIEGFSPESSYEQSAAEFYRFLPTSNWQTSGVSDLHPQLSQKLGNALSRKSRLDLDTAQCAYGMAVLHPEAAVILVTDAKNLLQVISQLGIENLTAVNCAIASGWLRTKQVPPLSELRSGTSFKTPSSATVRTNANLARFNKLVSTIIGWTIMVLIVLVVWRSLQPKQFKQIWQKTGLPNLPF
jgi:hypothetical protein